MNCKQINHSVKPKVNQNMKHNGTGGTEIKDGTSPLLNSPQGEIRRFHLHREPQPYTI